MININIIKKILLFLYAFYIIYSPNLLIKYGIDSTIILIIIFAIQLIIYIIKRKKIVDLITKQGVMFCICIIFLNIYFIFVALFNGISFFDIMGLRIIQNSMPIVYLFNIAFLVYYLKGLNYSSEEMMRFIFNVALFQGILCLVMFIFPSFREVALNLYSNSGHDNYWVISKRIYGITNDYTYGTPIFQGIICSVISIFAIVKNKKYFLYLPLIILSIVLNGRTGLIVYFVSLIFCLFMYVVYTKKIFKTMSFVLKFTFLLIIGIFIIKSILPNTFDFILSLMTDTLSLFSDNSLEGNYKQLFDTMLFFPKGIHFIFGHGIKVFGSNGTLIGYANSDIGYVNDMFLGGLVFAISTYIIYLKFIMSKISFKNKNNFIINKLCKCILVVSFIIANYKGEVFRSTVILSSLFIIKLILGKGEEVNE